MDQQKRKDGMKKSVHTPVVIESAVGESVERLMRKVLRDIQIV